MKPWIVLVAIAIVGVAWMARWSTPAIAANGMAYTLDRFTGQVWYITGDRMTTSRPAP